MLNAGKLLGTVCMLSFMVGALSANEEKGQALEQFKFDKLPTYYTGKIFPTPQKIEYSDEFFSLVSTAIVTGRDLSGKNLKIRFLKDRIEMNGGTVEIIKYDSNVEKYDTVIYLNGNNRGTSPPDKAQGYSISCFTEGKTNIVAVNSKNAQGLLWGIATLTQLIKNENGKTSLRAVAVSDYPDNEMRGFLSYYWPDTAVEYLLCTKMNSVVFQRSLNTGDICFRDKNWLTPEKVKSMKFYGAMAKEFNLNIYYSIVSKSLFVREQKDGIPLRCSNEEDFKIVYDTACLLAENSCGLYLAFDDFRFPVHPDDIRKFGSAREADIYFVDRLYTEVKKKYPDFKMVFCPPFYSGPNSSLPYPEDREEYLKALGERLDKGIDVFWTGPSVKFSTTTKKEVNWIRSLIKRKPILFMNPVATPHVAGYPFITDPITIWKDRTYECFYQDMRAVFANTMGNSYSSFTATLGDYSWNEKAYNPEESIRTVVGMLFGPEAFGIFDELNKKLSYFDVYGLRPSPAVAMKISELESKFKEVEDAYSAAEKYNKFALENLSGMKRYLEITGKFINNIKKNPNLKTFAEADVKVQADAEKEANFKKGENILLTPNNFLGGCGPSDYGNKCPKRLTTWVFGWKTVNRAMSADFECNPFPPSGDYKLIISGQDDDAEKECNIEIKVNDRVIFSGPSGFVKLGWSLREFNIPADSLQRNNKLSITNTEDSNIRTGPPFFMLNYAVLKEKTN